MFDDLGQITDMVGKTSESFQLLFLYIVLFLDIHVQVLPPILKSGRKKWMDRTLKKKKSNLHVVKVLNTCS